MSSPLDHLGSQHPDLTSILPSVEQAFALLERTFRRGGKLLVCGNGGSASDSEHIVGELMKGFNSPRSLPPSVRADLLRAFPVEGAYLAGHLQGALPALSLVSQTTFLTAFANDVAPDMVFAQQVYGYGQPGDALLAISTSGNSLNIVYALQVARVRGLATLGLTGALGGKLRYLCDVAICVPAATASDIQEGHLAIYHTLCEMLERAFFPV